MNKEFQSDDDAAQWMVKNNIDGVLLRVPTFKYVVVCSARDMVAYFDAGATVMCIKSSPNNEKIWATPR